MTDYYICVENTIPEVIPELDPSELERICEKVLSKEQVNSADINVVIVGDVEITALKKKYFNLEITTDVISFNMSEAERDCSSLEAEIVVNAEMAKRECEKNKFPPQSELVLYIVHGLLHQLGYDDQSEDEYLRMHNRENEILEELGFGRVFGDPEWNN